MSKPAKSPAKTKKGFRLCSSCKEHKLPTLFPGKTAEICTSCASQPAQDAPPPAPAPARPPGPGKLRYVTPINAPEHDPDEPANVFPQVELDPNNPTHQEMAARTLARRRLLYFIRRFRPKYMPGWVHEDICRRLERFVKQVEEGLEPRLLLMMPVRHGKQLADETKILTANRGWTTHGDLRAGDEVFGPDGKPTPVLAISEKSPSNVKVTLTNGATFLCHLNHEWTVYQRPRGRWTTVETRYWLEPGRFGRRRQLKSGGRYLYQLPPVAPLEYPAAALPLHPYAFGAWLGDGSVGKPCITHHVDDRAVIDAIAAAGYPVSAVCQQVAPTTVTTHFGSGAPNRRSAFSQGLKDSGALDDKHIPALYMRSSVEQRLELLAGLIDTDGHVDPETGRVRVVAVSDRLRDDVVELVRSLGVRAGCYTQEPTVSTSGIEGRRPTHYVSFTPTLAIPTRLPRKKITGKKAEADAVAAVEWAEEGSQGHCIQVGRSDGLYLAGEHLTPTHNSEISSRHFAPWVLGQHPDWEIIAGSGAQSLAMSFSRYIRDLVRDPAYQSLFPNMKLDPSSQSVENWNTTSGGGYLAAGIGTMITGRGAHILIIDDPVKDAEAADSHVIRDATWEWYMSTALTRLAPGGGVLGIMTWWHEDDWAGRIQQVMATGEGDKFEIVKYPAINELGDEYILPDDTIVEVAPGIAPPEGARLTRPHMTALHPDRYTLDSLKRRKANYYALGQQRWWAALYQQNPTPDEGAYFTKSMFQRYVGQPSRHNTVIFQAWDFAITEKQQSDWTAGTTLLQDSNDNLFVVDVRRFRTGDGDELMREVVRYAMQWQPQLIGFEDGQIWKALASTFTKTCLELTYYPSYEVLPPLTDKMVRAQPLRGRMQAGKVHFPQAKATPWVDDMVAELLRFPTGKHDDQVDSLAWAIRLTLSKAAPKPPPPPKLPSWKDKLNGILNGLEGGSHMSA